MRQGKRTDIVQENIEHCLFVLFVFPRGVLDEILNLILSQFLRVFLPTFTIAKNNILTQR